MGVADRDRRGDCGGIRRETGAVPGGGAGPDSTPFEKDYVMLEGEMTQWGDERIEAHAQTGCDAAGAGAA